MREALALAQSGVGLTAPNPAVGAVLVKEGRVIGRGTHIYDNKKHAEIVALEDAGAEAASGATLYINLEPCSHCGRTPPCADAVIAAGIARVVVAMEDPNPSVAGQGIVRLRAAGVQVDVGLMEDEAQRLNDSFAKWIRTGLPLVHLKAGISLDGKIAPSRDRLTSGEASRWITSEAARQHAQTLRHASDAILVGIGTVLTDDPMLTDRTGLPRRRPLLRVVLDRELRIPSQSKLVASAQHDLVVFTSETSARSAKADELRARSVQIEAVPSGLRAMWPHLLAKLSELTITSLLIEGGASIYASAMEAEAVDKLSLYINPRILGSNALSAFSGEHIPPAALTRFRAQRVSFDTTEGDLLVTGYIRDPYAYRGE